MGEEYVVGFFWEVEGLLYFNYIINLTTHSTRFNGYIGVEKAFNETKHTKEIHHYLTGRD